jgi:hypothetical protein
MVVVYPQYAILEKLNEQYKAQGLVVLAIDVGEPRDRREIPERRPCPPGHYGDEAGIPLLTASVRFNVCHDWAGWKNCLHQIGLNETRSRALQKAGLRWSAGSRSVGILFINHYAMPEGGVGHPESPIHSSRAAGSGIRIFHPGQCRPVLRVSDNINSA